MTTTDFKGAEDEVPSTLPLGLLLGRISAAFRTQLLEACGDASEDVRLIGLAMAIKNSPNATQASYARFLGIDLNTASRLISRAEQKEILRRKPSAADKRAFVLELSKAGHAMAKAGEHAVKTIEAEIENNIGKRQYAEFRKTAEQILGVASKSPPDPNGP